MSYVMEFFGEWMTFVMILFANGLIYLLKKFVSVVSDLNKQIKLKEQNEIDEVVKEKVRIALEADRKGKY